MWWCQLVYTCKDCDEKFLSWQAYKNHTQRHLQTHLDKWAPKQSEGEKTIGNDVPHGLMRELLKVFERLQRPVSEQ
jgi:hypothetical protein